MARSVLALTLLASLCVVFAAPPQILGTSYTIRNYAQNRAEYQATLTSAIAVTHFDQPVYVRSECVDDLSNYQGAQGNT